MEIGKYTRRPNFSYSLETTDKKKVLKPESYSFVVFLGWWLFRTKNKKIVSSKINSLSAITDGNNTGKRKPHLFFLL